MNGGDIYITFDNGKNMYDISQILQETNKGHTLFAFRSPYRYTSRLLISSLKQIPDMKNNSNGAKYSTDLDDKITNNFQLLYSQINNYNKTHKMYYEDVVNLFLGRINDSLRNCLNIQIAELGEIIDGNGTLMFKKDDQDELFNYNVLSSGEKEVVDMLIDVFVKSNVFNDSIYLIDEPELHINNSIQRKILI